MEPGCVVCGDLTIYHVFKADFPARNPKLSTHVEFVLLPPRDKVVTEEGADAPVPPVR